MLNHQTCDKLYEMKLSSMAWEYRRQLESPDTSSLSFDERFGMITDHGLAGKTAASKDYYTLQRFGFPVPALRIWIMNRYADWIVSM